MNVAFYIARRYFVARKSHNIINIISWISVVGIATGAFAMVVVLSVFNGFEGLVRSLYNVFDPDLLVLPAVGKTFTPSESKMDRIKQLDGVWYVSGVVEETALLRFGDRQNVVTLRGVDGWFEKFNPLDSMMIDGRLLLSDSVSDYIVPGAGVAYQLGINPRDEIHPVMIYLPRRTSRGMSTSAGAFVSEPVYTSGVFSVQQDFDTRYVLTSLRLMRRMLNYSDELTSLEIRLKPGVENASAIRKQAADLLGSGFVIKDRFEQQAMLYKIMKSEKWAVFLILSFIILIAAFNVVGSLMMLILDKRPDIAILQAMGASPRVIQQIFFVEGLIISVGGAFFGLLAGVVACLLQLEYGFLKLGTEGSTFVVSSYPVEMQMGDFVFTWLVVLAIGLIASIIPARQLARYSVRVARFSE